MKLKITDFVKMSLKNFEEKNWERSSKTTALLVVKKKNQWKREFDWLMKKNATRKRKPTRRSRTRVGESKFTE